jgi:hypothetical protein
MGGSPRIGVAGSFVTSAIDEAGRFDAIVPAKQSFAESRKVTEPGKRRTHRLGVFAASSMGLVALIGREHISYSVQEAVDSPAGSGPSQGPGH